METLDERTRMAYAVAAGGGALIWIAATAISGRTEAWDSSFYWTVAYPLSVCLAGGLGYWIPERPWRWAWVVMLAQAVTLAVTASSLGLLPLGLVMFAILALPGVAVAGVMARIRLLRASG